MKLAFDPYPYQLDQVHSLELEPFPLVHVNSLSVENSKFPMKI